MYKPQLVYAGKLALMTSRNLKAKTLAKLWKIILVMQCAKVWTNQFKKFHNLSGRQRFFQYTCCKTRSRHAKTMCSQSSSEWPHLSMSKVPQSYGIFCTQMSYVHCHTDIYCASQRSLLIIIIRLSALWIRMIIENSQCSHHLVTDVNILQDLGFRDAIFLMSGVDKSGQFKRPSLKTFICEI